ncbi:hypothetical protein [Pseudochrobactrum asaccharolyticum]|uniref:hypothetical protein n=1 Tax=Pseudochrobactrum asaccharolyticum TaxID=354351 RepID=UPI000DE8B136|nr:hypothetical protein [Pseudochrobactrum asaccharolyticum]
MEDRILPAGPAAQLNAGNRLSGGLLQQSDEYVILSVPFTATPQTVNQSRRWCLQQKRLLLGKDSKKS